MMGAMKSSCLARSGFACSYLAFVSAVTLFVLSSAQVSTWTKQPTDPSYGVLGENVFLEWNFTLKGNDKVFEFKLQQLKNSNQKDIVRYQPGGNVRVSSDFKGKFDMVKLATHPAYVLFDAETSDEAKYCCEVSTKDGYDNKSCIYLKILVRPSITEISRNQTWNETNDVTLSCNATGKPPPNVTWSNPGSEDMKYSESVLLLKNISRKQDGDYWCTASNRVGNATASVRVTVNYAPSIAPNSTRYNFTEGHGIELSCATDGRPEPTITWAKIGESSNVAYPDGQTLIITNANRTDAGTYRCTATNGIGDGASTSIHVNMFFPPTIHKGPANRAVNETSDLELFCNATGNPLPNITWSKVVNRAVQLSVDEVLKVENVSKNESGVYQCRASNGIGVDALASWIVTVNYKPEGTRLTSDANNGAVTETFQVTFFCSADSVPPPELELRFHNSSLGLFVNNTFTLENINASNQGPYECVPHNILGTGPTATLNLTVFVSPSINYISQNTTANETDDVMLFCNSSGNPIPNITWTFLENFANLEAEELLSLQQVNRGQAGTYRCTATNGVPKRAWADVHVQVNYKPEMKDGPSIIKSWINHETVVTCEAEGVPTPEIVWTRSGKVTPSTTGYSRTSTLQFTPQERNEFGILLCTAKNLLGIATKNITVKQLVVPVAPEILQIDVGSDNMEIHWRVSAADPDSPVLNYLVQVKKKDESHQWMNCTRIALEKSSGSMLCVMTDLKSGTDYIVRVAAKNVVGYSDFTVKQSSTKHGTGKKDEQKDLPGSTIDGIIAGVICFLAVIVLIVAIVKQRRSRSRDSNKNIIDETPDINGSSKKITITSYENPTVESDVPNTEDPQVISDCKEQSES